MLLPSEIHTEDLGPEKMMDNFEVFKKGSNKVMQVFKICKAFKRKSFAEAKKILKVWGLRRW